MLPFLTSCSALEGTFISTDLLFTVALVRLRQLLPLKTVKFEDAFAFVRLPQPCLLRRRELSLLQGFQFTVPGHARRLALLHDCLRLAIIVRPSLYEC